MYKFLFLIFLLCTGCQHYVQPTYIPLSYEKRILDLSTYKNIDIKYNNTEMCMSEKDYQLILKLLIDLKNYIEYQKITIDSLDSYQQKIYQQSSKK